MYEGEIKNMNSRIIEHQKTKKELTKGKKKNADSQAKEELTKKIISDWEKEKENLNKEKEEVKAQCQELQQAVKVCKEGKLI